jgi:hypothetical protein
MKVVKVKEFLNDLRHIIVRWILWRPWHMVVTGCVFILLLGLIASLTHSAGGHTHRLHYVVQDPSSTDVPSYSQVVVTPTPTPTASHPGPVKSVAPKPVPSPTQNGILDIATNFAVVWAHHTETRVVWLASLKPYVTPQLYSQFTSSDPSNVPVNTITGRAKLSTTADGHVQTIVPTDSYTLYVTLVKFQGAWLVDSIDMA